MLLKFSFLSYFEIVLYNLHHKIAFLLIEATSSFQIKTFFLFFFAGLLTILNPCFISIVPLSVSYLNSYKQQIYKNIFILGLVTSILVTILVTNLISFNYFIYLIRIPLLSLVILILLSLNLLQILNFSFYFSIPGINTKWIVSKSNLWIQCYLIGLLIGLTTVPCSSPILTIIHFWLHSSSKIFILLIYLSSYFIGCILPLLSILYIFINYWQARILVYISNTINPLMGFLTLTCSLFFLLEKVLL